MKMNNFKIKFVKVIPNELEDGIIYYSKKYRTASHLCACGCKHKVVTPIGKEYNRWNLKYWFFKTTLHPSIGNGRFPCHSHYWIIKNKVIWAKPLYS